MAGMAGAAETVASTYRALSAHLDERQRRLLLGVEARRLGRGGIKALAEATGVHPDTIARGVRESEGVAEPARRVRAPGGGRKKLSDIDPELMAALKALVDPDTRGDPMSPLVWTTKSTRNLAAALTAAGHRVSDRTVARMLWALGFSLQANAKMLEGRQHEDRDAQFRYLNRCVGEHVAAGQPVISVDTKKKELVGKFANGGREYQPKGSPVPTNVHDFIDKELGKAIPCGVYDVTSNTGWVSVGTDHDTAAFAVATLRRWWEGIGRCRYPAANRLLICADGGGSTGYRVRAWKVELAAFAAETGLAITVCHLPPGTSKWNKIGTPAVLPDHHELARAAPDQPPHDRRLDQQHHHDHRADRPLRPGHRRVPDRNQIHCERRCGATDHPTRLPRRVELHRAADTPEPDLDYFVASP
jgi:Rhodopirellula transposase DDE domain